MSNAIVSIQSIQIIAFLAITVLVPSYPRMKCAFEWLYNNEKEYARNKNLLTVDDFSLSYRFDGFNKQQIQVLGAFRNISELERLQREEMNIVFSDRQRDTFAKELKDLENMLLEKQQSLMSKFHGMINEIQMQEQERAAKIKEDHSRRSEVKKELLERVEEVEMQTLKTKREVWRRLPETEIRLPEKDHLIQEMQKSIVEMAERFRKMEIKSNKLEAKMIKMKKSMVKLKRDMQTNFSLSVEHLKAYTDDHFTQLKQIGENLKSNISKSEDSLVKLEYELSKCATIGNLSDLDRALREVAIASRVEHESLRTEMSIGDENVRKQCAGRDDVTEMNRKLTSLSTDVSKIQDHLGEKKKMRCENTLPLATCTKYVQQHLCRFEHTATQCCESCTKSVGLVPKRTSGTK